MKWEGKAKGWPRHVHVSRIAGRSPDSLMITETYWRRAADLPSLGWYFRTLLTYIAEARLIGGAGVNRTGLNQFYVRTARNDVAIACPRSQAQFKDPRIRRQRFDSRSGNCERRRSHMSNLVVIVFDDEATAFEMRTALVKMQK